MLKIFRFWKDKRFSSGVYSSVFDDKTWAQIKDNYETKDFENLVTTVDFESFRKVVHALEIAANQLEGVAVAIEQHGHNINVDFFIEHYADCAEKAKKVIKDSEM